MSFVLISLVDLDLDLKCGNYLLKKIKISMKITTDYAVTFANEIIFIAL